MSVDGILERKAVMARLKTLAGGRVFKGVPDDETHKRFEDGSIKLYFVVLFSVPEPMVMGRSMTGGDSETPHSFVITVTAYADDADTAEQGAVAVRGLLRDWSPNAATATPFSGLGGYITNNSDARKKPTRFSEGSHFTCEINLGAD